MPELKHLKSLWSVLIKRPGIGAPSVWHAVIVTFMHYFSWGLLTVPFIVKLTESFGDRAILVDGLVYGIRGLLAFLTTPLMGALSDFRGRKVVMLLAVVTTYSPIPFMMTRNWWFFGLLMVSSAFGSTYSSSLAYIADVTTPEQRSRAYGIISATFGAGMAFSPLLGTYLMDSFGSVAVMVLASITGLLNILFVIFAVPESLSGRNERLLLTEILNENEGNEENQLILSNIEEEQILSPKEKCQSLNFKINNISTKEGLPPNGVRTPRPPKNGKKLNKIDKDDEIRNHHSNNSVRTSDLLEILRKVWKDKNLLVIYVIAFLSFWPYAGTEGTLPVYLHLNMGFAFEEVSLMVGIVSMLGITTNLLLGHIMRFFGAKWSIRLGLMLLFSQLLLFGFGSQHWMFWMASILASMGTIIPAASSTVASIYASPENQGAVLGIISGLESLSEGIGPAIFGVLLYAFQDDSKKSLKMKPIPMPFVLSAIGVLVAIVLTTFIRKETSLEKQRLYNTTIDPYDGDDDDDEDEMKPLTGIKGQEEAVDFVRIEVDDSQDSE